MWLPQPPTSKPHIPIDRPMILLAFAFAVFIEMGKLPFDMAELAKAVGLAPSAVLERLDARTRSEAVALAFREGLLTRSEGPGRPK